MTRLDRTEFGSTSAAGAMDPVNGGAPVLFLVGLLAGTGTSSMGAMPVPAPPVVAVRLSERSGDVRASHASSASAIGELRRLSGLTWEQLARLFGTTRRALHFWASGKPMNADNEERLHRTLGVVRRMDRGTAKANRSALLDGGETGEVPFDLLANGDFDRAVELLGKGVGRRHTTPPSPSSEEIAKRAPRPPDELVGALHDRVHPASGQRISLGSLRAPRKG